MNVTYRLDHPEKGLIQYTDKKRHLWIASLFLPLLALTGIAGYFGMGENPYMLLAPLIFIYAVVPLLDQVFGSDENNPPEELVPQLEEANYYRILTWLTVPLHVMVLLITAWFVGTQELSAWSVLAVTLTAGIYSGLGINTAHELGHKRSRFEQALARIALSVSTYGHFCVEHNRGHHRDVATPEDPASSRMGESIYKFMLREIPGAFARGWHEEKQRLERLNKSAWSPHNEVLQSYALSILLQGSLIILFGWIMVPFLLIHNFWAWFQLTSANYIEHYGLLRQRKENGRYEHCQPYHSWNANYIFSNILLFHLERHSDHHANPTRRYQSLRNFDDIPELPNGYFGMFLVAYIPWLWYRIMDKRLLALPHIQGDLSKVNIDPAKRDSIVARYGNLEENHV
ncbi:MAG: alkane 1-monooxygenase [Gammaproteobacteria bacterium]|jgi:alkane 1-monooxygenase|nr:alkane 1-monooxygenase [Gammaproteobacteria bacterium]MBQ0773308.1 alkane 1-monooxygenase [Gammaproteobacteria bacterium]